LFVPDTEGNAQAIGQELIAGFGFDLAENPGDEIDEDRGRSDHRMVRDGAIAFLGRTLGQLDNFS
jgi:hypothetical protein